MDARRRALAHTAQKIQGGLPPYLRAAIVPGRGRAALPWDPPSPWLYGGGYYLGRWKRAIIFRAVWRQPRGGGLPPPKLLGARPLWGRAHGMGAGGSPRQCAINLKRGLPTATISGGAEGGLSASYLSVGYLLSDSSY